MPPHEQLLGLDVGQSRIGVARASSMARLAEPLMTIKTPQAISDIQKLIKEYGATTLVVGLPRGLNGHDTPQTNWVRDWVVKAKAKIDTPMYWQDEALTSHLAEAKSQTAKHPQDTDALAAAIILQDFLDTPEADRVIC